MTDHWASVSSRIKQSKKLRFNYLMTRIVSDEGTDTGKFNALDARVRSLEDTRGYSVVVTVKDEEDTAITGATVKFGNSSFTDNNDGTYTLTSVNPDTYTLTIVKANYENYTASCVVDYSHLAFNAVLEESE